MLLWAANSLQLLDFQHRTGSFRETLINARQLTGAFQKPGASILNLLRIINRMEESVFGGKE